MCPPEDPPRISSLVQADTAPGSTYYLKRFVMLLPANQTFKRVAFVIAVVITVLGIFLIGLNILDIAEDYRSHLPIATLNTVFISGVAALVVFLVAKRFTGTGSPDMLGLGSGVLAFGVGILIYSWFTSAVLQTRITVYDSAFLMAGLLHFCGIILLQTKISLSGLKSSQKRAIVLLLYLLIIGIIGTVTYLLYRGALPAMSVSRDLAQGISAVLCTIAAVISFKIYLKSHLVFNYWYALGLVLFAFGQLFISQGDLESRLAWLGRASQYIGGTYFLVGVLSIPK